MNGKECNGRYLKVDYDSKDGPKSSYHINTNTENNRLYNRDPIKLDQSKKIKKEREKVKLAKLQKHGQYKWSLIDLWSFSLIKNYNWINQIINLIKKAKAVRFY